jgi:redox-sensitive bicupin YhaK (pirin superfamily)
MVGADVSGAPDRRVVLPLDPEFEHALVMLEGGCRLHGEALATDALYYLSLGRRELTLDGDAQGYRILLLGGAPLGETIVIWWNFVARTSEEIVAAREDWQAGRRFGTIAAYAGSRIAAPAFTARPVGEAPRETRPRDA